MKTPKLMAVAACAAACIATTAFADGDDDIVASATPTAKIADPVNPRPGMVFKGYNIEQLYGNKFTELPTVLQKAATVKSTVVNTEKFTFDHFKSEKISHGVWEGFLKCKRSVNCTFLLKQERGCNAGYILFVNGERVISGEGQGSVKVDMKAGYNHIKLYSQYEYPVSISLKATDSLKEPKPLTPKDMFYDEKPDDGDVF